MRLRRRLLAALALALLLPVAALVALVTTETGSRWLLGQAAGLAADAGVTIRYQRVAGTLADALTFEDLRLAAPGLELAADHLHLAWHPAALLERRLHIGRIEVRGIRYQTTPDADDEPPAGPPALPDLALPVSVQVDSLRLEDVALPGDDRRLHHLALALRLDGEALTVSGLDVAATGAAARGELGLATTAPHGLSGGLALELDVPDVGPLAGRLELAGTALEPRLVLRVTRPQALEVTADLDIGTSPARFDVTASASRLAWPPAGEPAYVAEGLRVSVAGSAADYDLAVAAVIGGPELPVVTISHLEAEGDAEGLTAIAARIEALEGRAGLAGSLAWAPALRWDLVLTPEELDPGVLAPAWPGRLAGRLETRGSLGDGALEAELVIHELGGRLRDVTGTLAGTARYRDEAVAIDLSLDALEGRTAVTGSVGLGAPLSWELELDAADIDPAALAPEWPGALAARLTTTGRLAESGVEATVAVARLAGSLRGQPVSAGGSARYADGRVASDGLTVASGANRLEVAGSAAVDGSTLDLRYTIDAPALAEAYPGLEGSVGGSGTLGGSVAVPVLKGDLRAADIAYGELSLESATLVARWTEGDTGIDLDARGLEAGGTRLADLTLEVNGPPADHRIRLGAAGEPGSLQLAAAGGLAAGGWQGRLTALELDSPLSGPWTLRAPAALEVAAARARLGRLCIGREQGALCAEGRWRQAGDIAASGELSAVPLAWAEPFLPAGARIEGGLEGAFEVSGTVARPEVSAELRPGPGTLTLAVGGEPLEVPFRDARLEARYGAAGGRADFNLQFGDDGSAEGRIELGPGTSPALNGTVRARLPELALVAGFVPALEQVEGRLALDLAIAGELERPRLDGRLELAEGRAGVSAAGIELTDIRLAVAGDGGGPFTVSGGLASGPGRLTLEGTVDPWVDQGPGLDLSVSGADFQAVDLPQVSARVSPDLRLKGAGTYHLSGRLAVPRARIEVQELPPSAVRVSEDAVVVGAEEAPEQPPVQRVTADVDIVLGDDVRFAGFGLTTGLTGSLDAKVNDRGSRLFGRIDLVGAAYKAYGQNLTVERGRLRFTGPVENPNLELRALRTSNDGRVKAYLAVDGPIREPQPRVYTEPALPGAEALAYLVTGRGLDQASQQEGLDMAAVALSMGLNRGEPLLQDLSQQLGLDEIRVEGGDEGLADSSIILGKQLSPDLYLSYSQGLLNTMGEVILKLRLTDNLDVETRSGREQAVDLYYRLERD